MLRSLETVRVSLRDLEEGRERIEGDAPVTTADTLHLPSSEPSGDESAAAPAPPPPWAAIDLTGQSPPERARKLSKLRREIKTPEQRRGYLHWLFENADERAYGASVRKELMEFAFEREVFLAFDGATRARLGRWIREAAVAEAVPAMAVLATLRRAMWTGGEPPEVNAEIRILVDAASGCLLRADSEERGALLGRDFSIWLFTVREPEDREVLDKWARDLHPEVAEGVFRALAAMDALAQRVGGTGDGPTALELALGVWDRADNDARMAMAPALAAGWSRSFVLDRKRFFEAFWRRHQEHPGQREALLIVLASFEKELEAARTAESPAPEEAAVREAAPAPAEAESAPSPPSTASPFAEEPETEKEDTASRYFRTKRREIERAMQVASERSKPAKAAEEPGIDDPEDVLDALPDEGDVVEDGDEDGFEESSLAEPSLSETTVDESVDESTGDDRGERKPAPEPVVDEPIILPGEPLRTLADYTSFLRALSAGSPIDELLERHGMDYRQYASCMTAWGKVLQSRPDLAVRMGQLLRTR